MPNALNGSVPEREPTLKGRILLSLFFLFFLMMGLLFLSLMASSLAKEVSSYLWERAECTIISSAIEKGTDDGHAKYTFKAEYAYSKNGREYKSGRISLNYSGSSRYNDAQKLLNRFPAGSQRVCYVNPTSPPDAILVHNPSQLFIFPFMALPLIFVAIGGVGVYGIWSRKDLSALIKNAGGGALKKAPNVLLAFFFFAFLAVGLAVFLSMGVRPVMGLLHSDKWLKTPCVIVSSEVGSHSGDDGTTYSVDILYSYDVGGREYRSNAYGFMGGSSSGYKGKQEIVKGYPQGKSTFCYVNPEDPADAVLNRKFTADMLFVLIPLLFVIVGAGGVCYAIKRMSDRKNEDLSGYDSRALSDYSWGEVELKPVSGPWGSFLGGLLFTLIWNGILSLFVHQCVLGWLKGRPEWLFTIVLTPFTIIGLLCVYGTIYSFIALFNPRPTVRVNSKSVSPGGKLKIQWEVNENSAYLFRKLIINLKCVRGEFANRNSKFNIVDNFPVVETEDPYRIASGSNDVQIPEGAVPSKSSSDGEKIHWLITFRGLLRSRPKIDLEYSILVLPKRK